MRHASPALPVQQLCKPGCVRVGNATRQYLVPNYQHSSLGGALLWCCCCCQAPCVGWMSAVGLLQNDSGTPGVSRQTVMAHVHGTKAGCNGLACKPKKLSCGDAAQC